jgi:hypothetical protein
MVAHKKTEAAIANPSEEYRESPKSFQSAIFWEAEPKPQDNLERIPQGYNCHFPPPNRMLPQRTGVAA